MSRNVVDRQRRTDEVFYFLEDRSGQDNVIYYGRTDTFGALTTDPSWQIKQWSLVAGVYKVLYANDGKYNNVWTSRSTYFPAVADTGEDITSAVALPTGLREGGRQTTVALNAVTWTALPLVALANRNAICIQNFTGFDVLINFDSATVGLVGIIIKNGGERFYDIQDSIPIYAKSAAGVFSVMVEEIA